MLGCCGAKAAAGRACSGYLLELDGRRLWLDAGGGTLAELLRHTRLQELDAIAISHLHADHWTDLPLAVHSESFAYSADTGPCDALGELAHGARLFLCEAGAASVETDTHLTPEQAGEAARAAGAGMLVLTHLRAGDDAEQAGERARSRFDGELVVVRDGLEVRPRATARSG